jgi:hypothetical protein
MVWNARSRSATRETTVVTPKVSPPISFAAFATASALRPDDNYPRALRHEFLGGGQVDAALTPVITAILVFNVIAIRNRILPKQLCDHSGVEVGPDFRNNLVAKSHDPTITMVESHTILRSS